ncbi:peptidylprolyl isomerase [Pseudomonas aeruginosa]|uniref:FKBP-type peptidyl-prolyl cis-trans isomerase n=1 Tax=Pseudomonas aeruginosa TaxID=287 RepID=UPI000A33EED0|nr:FKBP-type peptidyl-prolyl cis-trans isomerase [Pseudomonas aeruginosa]OTJ62433.1 peptidylprolyl isomerase [Pseudomonas aeruginosa]
MPRRLFIGLFLLPLPLFAAPPKDELAYAVGARLGTRLQQEMPDLELSELLLGLRQAYRGEALEIPPERIEKLLLQHENATTETPRITPAEARFLANEKARFGVRELTGGEQAAVTDVYLGCRGLLADGQVFDQSESAEWFALDSVIEGWRTALRAMPVGACWRVVIPSAQAYGHEGAGDLIPPDAPLVFEIDLLGVR